MPSITEDIETNRTIEHLHIVCYKWGKLYGSEHVNKLFNMVKRNLPAKHTFHCITDNSNGILSSILVHKLPDLIIKGNWQKLYTFSQDFLGLDNEYILFLDLDIVIIDSLSFVLEAPSKDLLIAKNWSSKGCRVTSCCYRLRVGSKTNIWNEFIKSPQEAIETHHGKSSLHGDQQWVNHMLPNPDYFEANRVVSFKRHCNAKGKFVSVLGSEVWNSARRGIASPPTGASIISFHGKPDPQDVQTSHYERWRRAPFVEEHWK